MNMYYTQAEMNSKFRFMYLIWPTCRLLETGSVTIVIVFAFDR